MSASRPAVARAALVLAAIAATLALAELMLRLLVPPSASQVLRGLHRATPDRPWLYEMVPGASRVDPVSGVTYAVNAQGFRDRDHALDKPAGTVRVALLGDSVSFGYGVDLDATFARQLETRLAASGGAPRIEVLNLGVSGYNPYTEAALLDGVGLAYGPDLVLVQFCVNDLNDPTQHFDASTMMALGGVPDAAFPEPGRRAARPASVVPALLATPCAASRLCSALTGAIAPSAPREELVAALAPHENPSDAELAWLELLYARMARSARERGAALAVVVFPYQTQLQPGARDALQVKLRALGEQAGIHVIDLLPAFRRAAAEPGEPLFLDMWHPSARGQRVAAEATFRALACAQLLPSLAERCEG